MDNIEWIPKKLKEKETNWSTYPGDENTPEPELFIDPKIVCTDKKVKVC